MGIFEKGLNGFINIIGNSFEYLSDLKEKHKLNSQIKWLNQEFENNNFEIIYDKELIMDKAFKEDLDRSLKEICNRITRVDKSLLLFDKIIIKVHKESDSPGHVRSDVLELRAELNIGINHHLIEKDPTKEYHELLDHRKDKTKKINYETLERILKHEIIHIKHDSHKSKAFRKLIRKTIFYKTNLKNINTYNLRRIRLSLSILLVKLVYEGIAELYEFNFNEYFKRDSMTKDNLIKFSKDTKKTMLEFKEDLDEAIEKGNSKDFEEKYKKHDYIFGFVIIFTIVYAQNIKCQSELFSLKQIEAIKLYEKSVEKINKRENLNLTPIFSYSSGKGIVDYKTYIRKIKNKEKNKK